jgi:hypothetical protein
LSAGKHFSIILRNFPPIFVFTLDEKGGLNQVIFLPLCIYIYQYIDILIY